MRNALIAALASLFIQSASVTSGLAQAPPSGPIVISGPGVTLTFSNNANRLGLTQIQREGDAPLLYADKQTRTPGAGPIGNPLAIVISKGKYKGIYGMNAFHVTKLEPASRHLVAYLQHDSMPMQVALDISVSGDVVNWIGQIAWNGDEQLEADIYFPLLSRVRFDKPEKDRALMPQTSGSVLEPLSDVNYKQNYMGRLSSPFFLVEGGGRGLAVLDDNRADFAIDPGATSLRSYHVGSTFPMPDGDRTEEPVHGGEQGPYIAVCHTRVFQPVTQYGGEAEYMKAEGRKDLPIRKLGDAVDLGPVRMLAYAGNWKTGAAWLRTEREWLPFRQSPAAWYQRTTFLAEDAGDSMVRRGQTWLDLPKVLDAKRKLGAELFHLTGSYDAEVLGVPLNAQNRGDYSFTAENLGGPRAAKLGIEATHRAGGRVIFYVEGLIMWKRSRIGRGMGKDWALMEADGSYTEHYKGFWHMCPASPGWDEWFAKTLAEVVRRTGVDGFFIDSTLATFNHRCFNPAHHHPHPDVWNWGVRNMLRRIREEVDKVNPDTILIVEGCGDLGREFIDGTLSHGHTWTHMTFSEPLVRFVYPQMRAFESWESRRLRASTTMWPIEQVHVWNAVNGHRIYSHNQAVDRMAPYSLRTRKYYDSFPEICDNQMSVLDVKCDNCISQMFEASYPVITVGNMTAKPADAVVEIPVKGRILLDRVDGTRLLLKDGKTGLKLAPWEFRAFEIQP